jgi:tripartite-type tricarboxylate transporter receptor subunit TctC
MIDVVAVHILVAFSSLVQTTGQIQSGKLKALGVGSKKRVPILPDVPTIDEAGVPGYEASNWWGIVAPAGIPQAAVERIRKELAVVLTAQPVIEQFANEGAEVVQMSQAEFADFIAAELKKWQRVVKESGMKAE